METEERAKLVETLRESDTIADGDGPSTSPRWMMHRAKLPIGERIKVLRAAMGMSERELSEAIRVRWSVQKWEGGVSVPSFESLKRLVWFCRQHWHDFDLEDLAGPLGPDRWEE
ncbi:MAG: helix-turn-helix transcriptional regulator [Trueperaceae bacterium]|nr:helix-turn-helix transcriptional regulator [Trueperaceae bacterium]